MTVRAMAMQVPVSAVAVVVCVGNHGQQRNGSHPQQQHQELHPARKHLRDVSPAAAHVSLKLLLHNLRCASVQECAGGKAGQRQVHQRVYIAHVHAGKDGAWRHKHERAHVHRDLQGVTKAAAAAHLVGSSTHGLVV
eukprot:GHRQ01021933.1.p3 GENE.GHRQ01021933.1~~GHRQ01021933.1.p3  ORF type:complete len:137 (+),score=17.10 GHRQ01021933.1:3-413(+)